MLFENERLSCYDAAMGMRKAAQGAAANASLFVPAIHREMSWTILSSISKR
jgi:hypothetical protein